MQSKYYNSPCYSFNYHRRYGNCTVSHDRQQRCLARALPNSTRWSMGPRGRPWRSPSLRWRCLRNCRKALPCMTHTCRGPMLSMRQGRARWSYKSLKGSSDSLRYKKVKRWEWCVGPSCCPILFCAVLCYAMLCCSIQHLVCPLPCLCVFCTLKKSARAFETCGLATQSYRQIGPSQSLHAPIS